MSLNKIVASQMQPGFGESDVNEQGDQVFDTFQQLSAKILNDMSQNMLQEDPSLAMSANVLDSLMDGVTGLFSSINDEQTRDVAELVCLMLKTYCRFVQSNQGLSELETANLEMQETFGIFCEKMKDVPNMQEFLDFMKNQFMEILSVESVPELARFKSEIDTIITEFIKELSIPLSSTMSKSPQPIPDESGFKFINGYNAEGNMNHTMYQLPEDLKHAWSQGPSFDTFQQLSAKIVYDTPPQMFKENSPLEQSAEVMQALMDFVTDFFWSINDIPTRDLAKPVCMMLKGYCCFIKSIQGLSSELETANLEMQETFGIFCEKMKDVPNMQEFLDFMKKQFIEILSVESVPELGRFKSEIDTIINEFFDVLSKTLAVTMIGSLSSKL